MKPVAFAPGSINDLRPVIVRGKHGDAPALLMSVDVDDPLLPAFLLAFDRAMEVEGEPVSALVTNRKPPPELLAFGRAIGGVRHVDTSKPIAAQMLPLWGAPAEFFEADNFVWCSLAHPACCNRAQRAEEHETAIRFRCEDGHEVVIRRRDGAVVESLAHPVPVVATAAAADEPAPPAGA